MAKQCMRFDCDHTATVALKLRFLYEDGRLAGEAVFSMEVCEDHRLSQAELEKMISFGWERLAIGFDRCNLPRPPKEKTEFIWIPIEDAEEFWLSHVAVDAQNMRVQ